MSVRKRSFRRRQKPPFAERAKDHCRKFAAFMFSNVGIILLVIIYMIAGAFMFQAIEGKETNIKANEYKKYKSDLLKRLWKTSCCDPESFREKDFRKRVDFELMEFQKEIVNHAKKGGTDVESQWSFSGAFLYSLTVITTIGYGNISPRTDWGKVSTILYAIIGMPLFLLYLSNIGDILAKSFKWIYVKICLCRVCPGVARRRAIRERKKLRAVAATQNIHKDSYGEYSGDISHQPNPHQDWTNDNTDTDEEDGSLEDDDAIEAEISAATSTVTVPLPICVLVMIGYIVMGGIFFHKWEDWHPLDASYFCFISLSSIGFGDVVPGKSLKPPKNASMNATVQISFILCAIYLLLGMALIAMCFNLMQEQVMHKTRTIKQFIRRCCCVRCGR